MPYWYFIKLQDITGIVTCEVQKCPVAMELVTREDGSKFWVLTNNNVKSQSVLKQSSAVLCKLNLQFEIRSIVTSRQLVQIHNLKI